LKREGKKGKPGLSAQECGSPSFFPDAAEEGRDARERGKKRSLQPLPFRSEKHIIKGKGKMDNHSTSSHCYNERKRSGRREKKKCKERTRVSSLGETEERKKKVRVVSANLWAAEERQKGEEKRGEGERLNSPCNERKESVDEEVPASNRKRREREKRKPLFCSQV